MDRHNIHNFTRTQVNAAAGRGLLPESPGGAGAGPRGGFSAAGPAGRTGSTALQTHFHSVQPLLGTGVWKTQKGIQRLSTLEWMRFLRGEDAQGLPAAPHALARAQPLPQREPTPSGRAGGPRGDRAQGGRAEAQAQAVRRRSDGENGEGDRSGTGSPAGRVLQIFPTDTCVEGAGSSVEQERVRGPSRGTERMSQDPLGDTAGDTAGDSWLGWEMTRGAGDKTGRAPWLWLGQGGWGGAALGPEPEVTRSGVCCVSHGSCWSASASRRVPAARRHCGRPAPQGLSQASQMQKMDGQAGENAQNCITYITGPFVPCANPKMHSSEAAGRSDKGPFVPGARCSVWEEHRGGSRTRGSPTQVPAARRRPRGPLGWMRGSGGLCLRLGTAQRAGGTLSTRGGSSGSTSCFEEACATTGQACDGAPEDPHRRASSSIRGQGSQGSGGWGPTLRGGCAEPGAPAGRAGEAAVCRGQGAGGSGRVHLPGGDSFSTDWGFRWQGSAETPAETALGGNSHSCLHTSLRQRSAHGKGHGATHGAWRSKVADSTGPRSQRPRCMQEEGWNPGARSANVGGE